MDKIPPANMRRKIQINNKHSLNLTSFPSSVPIKADIGKYGLM